MTLDQVPAGAHVFVDSNILVYHFEPGAPEDGVTVTVPREGLPQELARLRVERRQARHEDEPAGHDDRIDRALPAGLQVGRERFYANADPIHRDTLTYQGVLMCA